MPIDRRALLKGIAGLAAGLVLPPSLDANAEEARRIWTGYGPGTMVPQVPTIEVPAFVRWVEAYEPQEYTPVDVVHLHEPGSIIWWAGQSEGRPGEIVTVDDLAAYIREKHYGLL